MTRDELTNVMKELGKGDKQANDRFAELVYDELREIARARMARMRRGHTITPTALVNEAFVRLLANDFFAEPRNRRYFFGAVGRAMSRILYDHEKKRRRRVDGRNENLVLIDDEHLFLTTIDRRLDLLALRDSLNELKELSEDQYEVIQLRFWAGCTVPQTAEMMEVSVSKVESDFRKARAFVYGRLKN